jgi:capsular polysaccharide transport system permease protein
MDAVTEVQASAGDREFASRIRRLGQRVAKLNRLFIFVVIVPTALAGIYFGLIAHAVYLSESQFVVRHSSRQAASGIGSLLQGTGLTPGSDDVYSVQSFILSRDALAKLEQQLQLRKSFATRDPDLIRRFPALNGDQSFEALLLFYRRHVVDIDLDSTSSILTLTVRAFTADQAYRINEALLAMSEEFVNRLNEREREDLTKSAAADVAAAEQEAKTAIQAVSSYRNATSIFDPAKQSDLELEQIGKLQEELIATRSSIADVHSVAARSPQIPVLEKRAGMLQAAIDTETAQITGDQHSLSSKSVDYEGVMLERDFADKRLDLVLMSLQEARADLLKQQFYLERIAQPNRPDVAIEPRRARDILATFMMTLIVWGVLSLLLSAVKEHAG